MGMKKGWVKPSEFLRLHPGLMSKNTLYEAIRRGHIKSIRLGPRMILIPSDALNRLYEGTD